MEVGDKKIILQPFPRKNCVILLHKRISSKYILIFEKSENYL
jgi:hypothetical protein